MSDEDLREIADLANEYTDEVDAAVRRLGIGGVAIIWLFRISSDTGTFLPLVFRWPIVLLVSALALDLLQSVAGALFFTRHIQFVLGENLSAWKSRLRSMFVSHQYARKERSEGFRPVAWLFWPKVILIVVAYVWLVTVLSREVLFT